MAYVGSASTNGNRTTHSVTTPSGVQAGDTLLLFLTTNSSAPTITAPAGWSEVRAGSVDGLQARVWSKTATAADAGAGVSVLTSSTTKSDLTVAAYRVNDGGSGAVSASGLSFSSSASRPADHAGGRCHHHRRMAGQLLGSEVLECGDAHSSGERGGPFLIDRQRVWDDHRCSGRLRRAGCCRHSRRSDRCGQRLNLAWCDGLGRHRTGVTGGIPGGAEPIRTCGSALQPIRTLDSSSFVWMRTAFRSPVSYSADGLHAIATAVPVLATSRNRSRPRPVRIGVPPVVSVRAAPSQTPAAWSSYCRPDCNLISPTTST